MTVSRTEGRFVAHPDKGEVSSLVLWPEGATHLLVLGHGYGTGMTHPNLEAIATELAARRIATFRYQHPYRERGGGRDAHEVTLGTIARACATARALDAAIPLLAGGHSFSGRMTTHAAAEGLLADVAGLVLVGFPLHTGAPDTRRAAHLPDVPQPMLFLTGTRDKMAEREAITAVVDDLGPRATLHLLDTADHGLKTLKRRTRDDSVFAEIGDEVAAWARALG